MKNRFNVFFTACMFAVSCSGKKACDSDGGGFAIVRADSAVFEYIVRELPDSVLDGYRDFLDVLGERVIYIGRTDSAGFYGRLKRYYSEPSLMGIYRDELALFTDVERTGREIDGGLDVLIGHFPEIRRPKVMMHVSGLNQSVIVTDSFVSISADKYLGSDYGAYKLFFSEYQRLNMRPDRMAMDCLLGFAMANMPFTGDADVLLDRMVYEGKLRYLLSRLLPGREEREYVGYTVGQYEWCNDNCGRVWRLLHGGGRLLAPDRIATAGYFQDAPQTALLPAGAPGRVGVWFGYRIVSDYMALHPETGLKRLMEMTDYRLLLTESKFRP
jgi:hypothetical protein